MQKKHLSREENKVRFTANMRRIGAITRFIFSGVKGLEQTGPFQSEGLRADILRMIAVFLHAAIEDFVRSTFHRKGFTFGSDGDLKKVFKKVRIDDGAFNDIFPGLNQLALRRIQIVHYGDLPEAASDAPSWDLGDDWQLIHWHLVVLLLYHRIRKTTGPTGMVEDRATENLEKAFVKNIDLGKALVELTRSAPERIKDRTSRVGKLFDEIRETLKLEVDMFLDTEGKPVEGEA